MLPRLNGRSGGILEFFDELVEFQAYHSGCAVVRVIHLQIFDDPRSSRAHDEEGVDERDKIRSSTTLISIIRPPFMAPPHHPFFLLASRCTTYGVLLSMTLEL